MTRLQEIEERVAKTVEYTLTGGDDSYFVPEVHDLFYNAREDIKWLVEQVKKKESEQGTIVIEAESIRLLSEVLNKKPDSVGVHLILFRDSDGRLSA